MTRLDDCFRKQNQTREPRFLFKKGFQNLPLGFLEDIVVYQINEITAGPDVLQPFMKQKIRKIADAPLMRAHLPGEGSSAMVIGIDVADHHVRDLHRHPKRVLTINGHFRPLQIGCQAGDPREPLIPFNPTEDGFVF